MSSRRLRISDVQSIHPPFVGLHIHVPYANVGHNQCSLTQPFGNVPSNRGWIVHPFFAANFS